MPRKIWLSSRRPTVLLLLSDKALYQDIVVGSARYCIYRQPKTSDFQLNQTHGLKNHTTVLQLLYCNSAVTAQSENTR